MNIVIYKDKQYDRAIVFENQTQMENWAERNRDLEFRAFQAQEFIVNKAVTFNLKPVTRDGQRP